MVCIPGTYYVFYLPWHCQALASSSFWSLVCIYRSMLTGLDSAKSLAWFSTVMYYVQLVLCGAATGTSKGHVIIKLLINEGAEIIKSPAMHAHQKLVKLTQRRRHV